MDQDLPNRDRPESDPHTSLPVAGDELLPEVEPPSARFIVQLFVVPALIVFAVFVIWLLFSWLVHRTTMNPTDLIQGLQSSSIARWQRASELADLLRNERYAAVRDDAQAASRLAAILDQEIDAAESNDGADEEGARLRFLLCRALGEFRVTDGSDVLVKAATTNRGPGDQFMRRGAIQAIAVRAFNLSQLEPPQTVAESQLESALLSLASDDDDLIRSETAYALGRIGTPASLKQLETMVDDPHADTRYNAAIALAEHGNPRAVSTLAEMLDPEEMASVRQEENEPAQIYKRGLIMTTALEAVETLVGQAPSADYSGVIEVLARAVRADEEQLLEARIRPAVIKRAQQTLELLRGLNREGVTESER